MDAKTYQAANNLLQAEDRPNWYDLLPQVEAAMRQADEDEAVRREFGWVPDEAEWVAPDPLNPGQTILESDWEDCTALAKPEDMGPADRFLLEVMETYGANRAQDSVDLCIAIAKRAATYLHAVGRDEHGKVCNGLPKS